jgi:hypothetical protein
VWGGPNLDLSLRQARANFKTFGAIAEDLVKFVRRPKPEEL